MRPSSSLSVAWTNQWMICLCCCNPAGPWISLWWTRVGFSLTVHGMWLHCTPAALRVSSQVPTTCIQDNTEVPQSPINELLMSFSQICTQMAGGNVRQRDTFYFYTLEYFSESILEVVSVILLLPESVFHTGICTSTSVKTVCFSTYHLPTTTLTFKYSNRNEEFTSPRTYSINTNPKQLFFDNVQLSWTVPLETGFWPRKHTFFLPAITRYPRLSRDWQFCQKTVKDMQPCVHAHTHTHTHTHTQSHTPLPGKLSIPREIQGAAQIQVRRRKIMYV